jgi:uncharacterized protein YodC (DUF2158 family)
MSTIKAGDVVHLKSDGPLMTVRWEGCGERQPIGA